MNPERRPLLMDAEVQGRSARPRPDVRSSPESALVDVKSEDEGTYLFLHYYVLCKSSLITFIRFK